MAPGEQAGSDCGAFLEDWWLAFHAIREFLQTVERHVERERRRLSQVRPAAPVARSQNERGKLPAARAPPPCFVDYLSVAIDALPPRPGEPFLHVRPGLTASCAGRRHGRQTAGWVSARPQWPDFEFDSQPAGLAHSELNEAQSPNAASKDGESANAAKRARSRRCAAANHGRQSSTCTCGGSGSASPRRMSS